MAGESDKVSKKSGGSKDTNKKDKEGSVNSKNQSSGNNKKNSGSKDKENKVNKDELITKLKESEEKYRLEKEDCKKQTSIKAKDLDSKEKILQSISSTNKKLSFELDNLRKMVEEREKEELEREHAKENAKKKKENPIEIVLKVKEKELEEAVGSLDSMKKENSKLKEELNEKSDYAQIVNLENKLLNEEKKGHVFLYQLRNTNKIVEDHKKCTENKEHFLDREKKRLESELKALKFNLKNQVKEKKEEDNNIKKSMDEMITLKRDLHILVDKKGMRKLEEDSEKQKEELKHIEAEHKEKQEKKQQQIKEKEAKEKEKEKELEQSGSFSDLGNTKNSRHSNSNSNTQTRKKLVPLNSKKKYELFTSDEKKNLSEFLNKADIDRFEKRFDSLCFSRDIEEKKSTTETKISSKKIKDVEERLEFNILQLKEQEQRSKLLSFQIGNHKEDNKKLTKRIQEAIHIMNDVRKAIADKEVENKSLVNSIHEMKVQFEKEIEAIRNPEEPEENNEEDEKMEGGRDNEEMEEDD